MNDAGIKLRREKDRDEHSKNGPEGEIAMDVQTSTAGAFAQEDQGPGKHDGNAVTGEKHQGAGQRVAADFRRARERKGCIYRESGYRSHFLPPNAYVECSFTVTVT
jgi:hypothetical protein